MHSLFTSATWAGMALAAAAGFAGCTTKEDIEPDEPCSTSATVRFCYAKTAVCDTEHTSLQLTDGTRIRPSGKVWQAYLPKQVDGQVLRISYRLTPRFANDNPEIRLAELTCLENQVLRCGTW